MEIHHQYKKIAPLILFTLALVLLFNIARPMIVILLSSILLAYISFPLYRRINRKITNKTISIILSLAIIFIIILIPLSFLAFGITQQGYYFYHSLSDDLVKGSVLGFGCSSEESSVCLLINQAEKFSLERLSAFGFDEELQKILPILEGKIIGMILSIPVIIAQIFLAFIIAYFIIIDWKNILKSIVDLLPMRAKTIKKLIREFGNITHTVIYAQLFVAFIQGIIGIIGFYIFGVPFPILLGVLLAFCALLPAIGTAIIWVPVSLIMIFAGAISHNYWVLSEGIGLFLYGLFIISTIDNVLLAKIVSVKAKVNPIIVIVGVIGGAAMFGIMGIFIGPILLPLIITYFQMFKQRFK